MDKAHRKTDAIIERNDRWIKRFYAKNKKALMAEWSDVSEALIDQASDLLMEIQTAENDTQKALAEARYKRFMSKTMIHSPDAKKRIKRTAKRLTEANNEMAEHVNGEMPAVYALNYNFVQKQARKVGVMKDFTVSNREAQEYGGITQCHFNEKKDTAYNTKTLINAITTAIVTQIAVADVVGYVIGRAVHSCEVLAQRTAQDFATDAESKGRQDSMWRMSDLGYSVNKQWVATLDNRTRESHRRLDGVSIPLDAEFLPNLSRPRDPRGPLSEIINCRCSLKADICGVEVVNATRAARQGEVTGSYWDDESFKGTHTITVNRMNYGEWMRWKNHG